MAKCRDCGQEMQDRVGCKVTHMRLKKGGKAWPRLKNDLGRHCGDCACPDGTFHHPGCDMERCPAGCGGQAIGCDCRAGR